MRSRPGQHRAQPEAKTLRPGGLVKLEALEALAIGTAHDANNVLTVISGNLEWIAGSHELPAGLLDAATDALAAAGTARELLDRILAHARDDVASEELLDASGVVRGLLPVLRGLAGRDVLLRAELAAGLAPVRGDRVLLERVLLNLVANARDAMPEGGTLSIRTGARRLGAGGERYVTISVRDSGSGMEPDVRRRAFEARFTTKPGRGCGLGLAVARAILRGHGGHLTVSGRPGRGSTFRLWLPEPAAGELEGASPASRGPGAGGVETIAPEAVGHA